MNKLSPLITAIIGAVILVVQQALSTHQTDWKVIGFAALIAVIGAVGTQLKGKGASVVGVIGTVAFTFYQVWNSGTFSWSEFGLAAILAVASLFAPTLIPQPDPPKE